MKVRIHSLVLRGLELFQKYGEPRHHIRGVRVQMHETTTGQQRVTLGATDGYSAARVLLTTGTGPAEGARLIWHRIIPRSIFPMLGNHGRGHHCTIDTDAGVLIVGDGLAVAPLTDPGSDGQPFPDLSVVLDQNKFIPKGRPEAGWRGQPDANFDLDPELLARFCRGLLLIHGTIGRVKMPLVDVPGATRYNRAAWFSITGSYRPLSVFSSTRDGHPYSAVLMTMQ